MTDKIPHLVQRIKAPEGNPLLNRKGVDRVVEYDYMGSSEFEWGALRDALKRLKAAKGVELWPLTIDGIKFRYVGTKEQAEEIRAWVQADLAGKWHGQEASYLRRAIGRHDSWEAQLKERTCGWWALDEGINPPWILFSNLTLASAFFKELTRKDEEVRTT
jgi:hypothetical protein